MSTTSGSPTPGSPAPSPGSPLDVAIVGGGISGVYSAYRLARWPSPVLGRERPRIGLFEASDRIGGRLWSIADPAATGAPPAELGGMAFAPHQQSVFGLAVGHLGLKTREFRTYTTNYLQYLRGRRFDAGGYANPHAVPYALDPGERGKDPTTLLVEALFELVPARVRDILGQLIGAGAAGAGLGPGQAPANLAEILDHINTLATALREATIDSSRSPFSGRPLWEVSMWSSTRALLSAEAAHLCFDSAGLGTPLGDFNLCDAISFLFTFALLPFSSIVTGYQTLPLALRDRAVEAGVELGMQTRLRRVQRQPGGELLALEFDRTREHGGVETHTRLARHVILALPRAALASLDASSVIFEPGSALPRLQHSVHACPSTKLFLVYPGGPWWRELEIEPQLVDGRSVTDLPLRQCLYEPYYPEGYPHADAVGSQTPGALLMAAYSDDRFTSYWHPAERQTGHTLELARLSDASRAELRAQLEAIHGAEVPEAGASFYADWGAPPFGAAWHLWRPGVKSWELIPKLRQPVADAGVYLCGESFCARQGWAHGALDSAEKLLETTFGLERPDWVLPNYDFGP